MEVIILDSARAVARLGAARVAELVNKKPAAVLGLATGSTPIALYRQLIRLCRAKQVSNSVVLDRRPRCSTRGCTLQDLQALYHLFS